MTTSPRKNHAYGINLAVAQELTAARIAADYTEESLAAALPFSLRSLQRYLKGESAVDVEVLHAICAVLGVSEVSIVEKAQQRNKPRSKKAAMQQEMTLAAREEDASA